MKIDRKFIDKLSKCEPDEFDRLLETKSFEDLLKLVDFVRIMDENHNLLLTDTNIKNTSSKIIKFYQDLINEGLLKIDYFSFDRSTLETMKDYQARKEIFDKRIRIEKGVKLNEYFLLMNEIYSTIYEKICSLYLKQISEVIKKTKITRKGTMIKTINDYKKGKFKSLFNNLNSKIRNSISHEDFYISKDKPKITFYNEGTAYLTISKQEYEIIYEDLFCIQTGFDIAQWGLTKELEYDLISRLELVSDYSKKKGLKLKPSKTSRTSVYDYSEMIKKGII